MAYTERQILDILKKYKIPFVDPCDADYEGDCEICPTDLIFPEAINICDTFYPAGTTLVSVLADLCEQAAPTIQGINGLTDIQGATIDIKLGGNLIEDTTISGAVFNLIINNLREFEVEARNEMRIKTPGVFSGSANIGEVLVLQALDGEVEFQAIPGDDWGSQVVITDASLTGDGTIGNPLSVAIAASILADNGLYIDVDTVKLGGTLIENTFIDPADHKITIGTTQILEIDGLNDYLRIVPLNSIELTRVKGAALIKNLPSGQPAHVTYTEYGLPTVSPTTFGAQYVYRWNVDGTGEWIYVHEALLNGLTASFPGLVGSTESMKFKLGGTLYEKTEIAANAFDFILKAGYGVSGNFSVGLYDSGIDPAFSSFVSEEFIVATPGNHHSTINHGPGRILASVNEEGTKTVDLEITEDYVILRNVSGGNTGEVEVLPGHVRVTVPEYASDVAADAALPSGALYRLTGTRQVLYRP